MGYSCTAIAGFVQDQMLEIIIANTAASSNVWTRDGEEYFFERGRENHDGSITGGVWHTSKKYNMPYDPPEMTRCRKIGSARIEPNGKISRWPTSTKKEREDAYEKGKARFIETYGEDQFNYEHANAA